MKMHPLGETRDQREQMTLRALSHVIQQRMHPRTRRRRIFQTELAKWSGVSRTKMRNVLLADQGTSLFVFLELCEGLSADHCEILKEVLNQRDVIRSTNNSNY